jgi:hypothetical protein
MLRGPCVVAVCQYLPMTSPDDPEERIRQLEQSAASYGAVELGIEHTGEGVDPTPAYGNPPPYGGQPYGGQPYGGQQPYSDPYQPPFGTHYTPVKKTSVPVGLVIGVLVFVFVVLGGIALVVANLSSTIEDSDVAGGGGPFDRPGDVTYTPPTTVVFPSMPNIPGIPSSGTEDIAIPGGQLSIAGVDGNKTLACNENSVSVSGVNNTVTLTGHCLSVNVSGVDNKVTIDGADMIGASGFDNEVIYLSGEPQINATGSNTVSRG